MISSGNHRGSAPSHKHTHTHTASCLYRLYTQLALTLIVHGVHVGKVLIELQTGVVHLGGDKGGQVEGRDAVL